MRKHKGGGGEKEAKKNKGPKRRRGKTREIIKGETRG